MNLDELKERRAETAAVVARKALTTLMGGVEDPTEEDDFFVDDDASEAGGDEGYQLLEGAMFMLGFFGDEENSGAINRKDRQRMANLAEDIKLYLETLDVDVDEED